MRTLTPSALTAALSVLPDVGPHGPRVGCPRLHPGAQASTVVPLLQAPATRFQHSHIVSEHGVATVWGGDQGAQARRLVERVASLSVHEPLREAAARRGLSLGCYFAPDPMLRAGPDASRRTW